MNSTVYNAKNKYIILAIAIIMFIPTIFAIHFNSVAKQDVVSAGRIKSISISSPDGKLFSVEEQQAITLYSEIIKSAQQINENFRDLSAEKPYVVKIVENDDFLKIYDFYMENEANGCIFTDSEGRYFLVEDDDALELLSRPEFLEVNTYSVVPDAVITRNGSVLNISPSTGEWSYKGADGTFSNKQLENEDVETPTARINSTSLGELSFAVSKEPDKVNVTLSKDGEVKHTGRFDTLINANVMAERDTYYDLEIEAIWEPDDNTNFFGKATYKLSLLYDVAPTYTVIHSGVVSRGGFTVIRIQNFNDGDKLFAECEKFAFPKELNVYRLPLAGYSVAFLPAKFDPAESTVNKTINTSIKLVLEDGTSQTKNVTINPVPKERKPNPESQDMLIAEPELQSVFTAEAFEEFEKTVAESTAESVKDPLWTGKFVYPDAANKGKVGEGMAAFGTKRMVRGLYQKEYVHNGIDIAVEQGATVHAANNGVVVFAGNLTLTGNTVIIDHGCSIFTYYGHLESISVAVGNTVTTQAEIGKAGATGFAAYSDGAGCKAAPQIHFAASVGGEFINPYYLWKHGVNFGD